MVDFNIQNGKLIIDPNTLTVAAFNAIWEYDTGKHVKPKASNMLTYIFHMCDIRDKNPFRDLPYDQKEAVCKRNSFGDMNHKFKGPEKELLETAMAWYEELNKDSIQRLGLAMDRKIDQVVNFMNDPLNDIKTLVQLDKQSDMLQRIDKILISKKKTDEFIRNELTKTKIKGGNTRSLLSSGMLS